MSESRSKWLKLGLAITVVTLAATFSAHAAGTPAGTVISNQATVDYEDVNGNPLQQLSNVVTTTVSAVDAVDIAPPALAQNADPGDLVCYLHTVTNNGNQTDTIDVDTLSSQGWAVVVYEDVNGNGSYDAGTDTPLGDTTASGVPDTGPLPDSVSSPGNESMDVFVCVTVPTNAAAAAVDTTDVTVTSDNDGAQTDAAIDTTTIQAPSLGVVKSVLPAGPQPPGTTLTYTVVITNNGNGNADNIEMTDPIPANTTYQTGTITQDAASRTDAADADNADFNVSNAGQVTISIGTMLPLGATTVTFQVQIN